jgi:hypothetical protein
MRHSTCTLLIGAVLGFSAPLYAQQANDTPASSAATSSTTAPSSSQSTPSSTDTNKPDEAMLKRAKEAGLKPETHNGKTMYCWEDANLGTRFPTKKCTDDTGLSQMVAQREAQKQNMRQSMSSSSSH